jgi:molecular chaperone HtpG
MAKAAKKLQETTNETIAFGAEISRVLHLMIHALYTNKDIFLRELISNASDACDKLRYEARQNDALMQDGGELGIHLSYDAKAKTLTIEDSGIGMNREDLIANLGTIAKSGTREFFQQLSGDSAKDANLIGQFGVGFYASFMVADRVVVHTRKAGEPESWEWESDGQGSFSVREGENRARGTRITLYMKDEALGYLDKHKLQHIVQTYSDHIAFPVTLRDDEGKESTINDGTALWTKPKSDITEAQYQEFYRHIAHSPEAPFMVLHNKAEGALEYTNLLFIPGAKPFDLFHPDRRCRVKLYVKRVYITDEGIELIPPYLRFLRGLIDSADLPLNISRETLQKNATLDKIRESVTSRVLSELKKRSDKEPEAYATFWKNFGSVLKEGLCEANSPRDKILDVCRFASTHSEEGTTTLAEYKSRMQEGQEAIYYITGDSLKALAASPQLEGFKKHGIEVLLLTDHVDDFWTNVTLKYGDIELRAAARAGDDLEKFTSDSAEEETKTPAIEQLITRMKTLFGDEVADVRTTQKLAESPVCLAAAEGAMDGRMERFLMEHNQLNRRMPKILEINPTHPLIVRLAENATDEAAMWLLLDQARIAEGEPLADMGAFLKRLNQKLLGE